jgi:valyl-tRNA synthetase
MPFITEEIWQKLGGVEPSIMVAPYPVHEEVLEDPEAERIIDTVQQMITTIRNLRVERGYTPSDRFNLFLTIEPERVRQFFEQNSYLLRELARLNEVVVNGTIPHGVHRDVIGGIEIAVEFPEKTMSAEQLAKLNKDIEQVEKEMESIDRKLADEKFVQRAPAHIVQQTRDWRESLSARLEKLRHNLPITK